MTSKSVYDCIKKEQNIYNRLLPGIWNIIIKEYICIDANNIKIFEYSSEYIRDIYKNIYFLNNYLEMNYIKNCRKSLQRYLNDYKIKMYNVNNFYYNTLREYEINDNYPYKMYNSTYFKKKYINNNILPSSLFITLNINEDKKDYITCTCNIGKNKRKHQNLCLCIKKDLICLYYKIFDFSKFISYIENLNRSKVIKNYEELYYYKDCFTWYIRQIDKHLNNT